MKEIGEKLKQARESIGIAIDEAAEDLKMKPNQIEDVEAGNMESFKDIFDLKYFIRDYAKYLGLNKEDMVDEFNEYLFDYTSKISLEEIKRAKKNEEIKEKKISSPYTLEYKKRHRFFPIVGIIVIIVLIIIALLIFNRVKDDNEKTINEISVIK